MSFMDAREHGSKPGSGGAASQQNESQTSCTTERLVQQWLLEAIDRRERLRRLALETIDLSKDPYFMRNHLGQYECRLCLTLHNNEGNYLAHTQGKRHQTNLAKRAARESADKPMAPQPQKRVAIRKTVKIGRPGYKVTKQFDRDMGQRSLLFQIEFPEIEEGGKPRHRFMSAWEQRKEAWDSKYQYLLFAAEPYEVISFKVPNIEVDRNEKFFSHWDPDGKVYSLQMPLKVTVKAAAETEDYDPLAADGPSAPPQGPPPQLRPHMPMPPRPFFVPQGMPIRPMGPPPGMPPPPMMYRPMQ